MPKTRQRDFRDDDGDSTRERLFEDVEDTLDAYMALFKRLQERAFKHGFSSAVILSADDPLTDWVTRRCGLRGNYYQNYGALHATIKELDT